MNSRTASAPWARRAAIAGCAALALAATSLGLATGATAAPAKGFIASPNGMVGLSQTVLINAPGAKGQVVTIGLQNAQGALTLQTSIGSNGYGSVNWTPNLGGAWTINGLGNIISSGSTTINVAAMPTNTTILAANNMQQDVENNVVAVVTAPLGTLAPTGTVSLATSYGGQIGSQSVSSVLGTTAATATIPWVPTSGGLIPISATFAPNNTANGASTSPLSTPSVTTALSTVALAMPTTMYQGSQTVIQAVLGNKIPAGTVAFLMDGKGISGSIPTVNGVATLQFTPPAGGIHYFSAMYSSYATIPAQAYSGTANQSIFINNAKASDNIIVDPPGQPAWSIAAPITMTAGSTVNLAGAATSGSTVVFSEQGPCYINGATLYAPSVGSCQITAQSAGSATLTPTTEQYTVTVTAAPKKKRS